MKKINLIGLFLVSICCAFGQVPNDICTDAIILSVDGSCGTYSNDGATNSANPFDGLTCGSLNAGHPDVWFMAIVPSSGNITVETFESVIDGLERMHMEMYSGSCNALVPISCSSYKDRFGPTDNHARIELEGLTPGEIVYIRAIHNSPITGNFDICASDVGYVYPCKILHVEIGAQSVCDPVTNTYDQEFIVHYQMDGSANFLWIEEEAFALTGSPQSVVVENLPANGATIDFTGWMYMTSPHTFNICQRNSFYEGDDFYTPVQNCFGGTVSNDECEGAIDIPVSTFCDGLVGDNTGATTSSGLGAMCNAGAVPQDVWYRFVVPPSGDVVINSYRTDQSVVLVEPLFEVYEGDCGALNLIQTSCLTRLNSVRFSDLVPGEVLYLRVADNEGDHQGEFGICVFEAEPFTNDICTDAIDIPTSAEPNGLIFSTHFASAEEHPTSVISCDSGSPSEDIWFRVLGVSGSLIIETSNQEFANRNLVLEVFLGDCSNLTLLDCDDNSGSSLPVRVELMDLDDADLFIRAAARFNRSVSFGINIIQIPDFPNDICSDAIMLNVDGSCGTYSNDGATNSANPFDGLSCGIGNAGRADVWFQTVVPASGNITVETFEPLTGGLLDVDIELYAGTCGDLIPLSCNSQKNRFNSTDFHARVELEGLSAGETIYIRVIAPSSQIGDFDICVSDMGYTYPCRILNVTLGSQSPCNPVTNSNSQDFIIEYQTDGSATGLRIENQDFDLTGSPQTVTISDIPSNGSAFDFSAWLYESSTFENTECQRNSFYTGDDFYTARENCFSGNVINDDCVNAIDIPVSAFCDGLVGDITGATTSPGLEPMCFAGDSPQDIWYRFTVPASGDVVIASYGVAPFLVSPTWEIYDGDCGTLNLLEPSCNSSISSVRLSNLEPGDVLYLRIAEFFSDAQGEFGICVFEAEPFTNDICADAIELSICEGSTSSIYSTHFANAEENPTSGLSCGTNTISEDIWFMVPGVSGSIIIETTEQENANRNPNMEVFTGDCNNLILLDCDDDSGRQGSHARVELTDLDNTDLFIRVDVRFNRTISFGIDVIGDLSETIDLTMDINDAQHIRAEQTITADNTILLGGDVIYEAGNCIELEAGFEVEDDALFEAIIDNCD